MNSFPVLLPNNAHSQIQLSSSGEKEGGWIFWANYRDHSNRFWKAKIPSLHSISTLEYMLKEQVAPGI